MKPQPLLLPDGGRHFMFIITTKRLLPNNYFGLDRNIMAVCIISIPIQIWKKRKEQCCLVVSVVFRAKELRSLCWPEEESFKPAHGGTARCLEASPQIRAWEKPQKCVLFEILVCEAWRRGNVSVVTETWVKGGEWDSCMSAITGGEM